eukprot:CAMPEP_0115007768 /NCGR_PEP_ID=MMETSP0216-20121206/21432_1 /TAXON_ID=223996 /ORGANISM="Protocruzia adherens, Strain Boccale" /LENGTH=464 /DNA_ID=CAMNT_0002374885 /DNA_START=194 /DNA_END=1588 /DNA_ORIENTATION=+
MTEKFIDGVQAAKIGNFAESVRIFDDFKGDTNNGIKFAARKMLIKSYIAQKDWANAVTLYADPFDASDGLELDQPEMAFAFAQANFLNWFNLTEGKEISSRSSKMSETKDATDYKQIFQTAIATLTQGSDTGVDDLHTANTTAIDAWGTTTATTGKNWFDFNGEAVAAATLVTFFKGAFSTINLGGENWDDKDFTKAEWKDHHWRLMDNYSAIYKSGDEDKLWTAYWIMHMLVRQIDSAKHRLWKGIVAASLADYAEASNDFKLAIEYGCSDFTPLRFLYPVFVTGLLNSSSAANSVKSLISISSNKTLTDLVEELKQKAEILMDNHLYVDAAHYYLKIVKIGWKDDDIIAKLGAAYLKQGSVSLYQAAIRWTKGETDAYLEALAKFASNDFPAAAQDFTALYAKDGKPAFLFNVALSYHKANDLKNAATAYLDYLGQRSNDIIAQRLYDRAKAGKMPTEVSSA